MLSVPSRGASAHFSLVLAQTLLLDLCMPQQGHGEHVLLQTPFVPGLLDLSDSRAEICSAMFLQPT